MCRQTQLVSSDNTHCKRMDTRTHLVVCVCACVRVVHGHLLRLADSDGSIQHCRNVNSRQPLPAHDELSLSPNQVASGAV